MPKTALTHAEWRKRLHQYASGSYQFGRGQRPGKQSRWAAELVQIDKCPKHRNPATHNPFGQEISCKCGYHIVPQATVSTTPTLESIWHNVHIYALMTLYMQNVKIWYLHAHQSICWAGSETVTLPVAYIVDSDVIVLTWINFSFSICLPTCTISQHLSQWLPWKSLPLHVLVTDLQHLQ